MKTYFIRGYMLEILKVYKTKKAALNFILKKPDCRIICVEETARTRTQYEVC